MTLPASGAISFSQINTELGRSSSAAMSLQTAETGGYVALNSNSPYKPNGASPYAVSEWYCYNQQAFTPLLITTTGSGTWTCPTGCTQINVECWGSGGAGGNASGVSGARGGGGAGGQYVFSTLFVTPGTVYSYNVAPTRSPGAAVTDTWFGSTSTVIAKGGANGSNATTNVQAANGVGSTTGGIGFFVYSGGSGSTGAGGGGAGSTGNGNSATGATSPGTAKSEYGGAGGSRGTLGTVGQPGSVYGGAGGGGYANSSTLRSGGNGAQGLIRITNITTCTPVTTTTTTTAGAAGTISIVNSGDACGDVSATLNGTTYVTVSNSPYPINTGDVFSGSVFADCYGYVCLTITSSTRGTLFTGCTGGDEFGPGLNSGDFTRQNGENITVNGAFYPQTPPGPCFVAGTMIRLSDGTEVPVETLSEGIELESSLIETLQDTNDVNELYKWSTNNLVETRTTSKIAKYSPEVVDRTIKVNGGLLHASYNHTQLARRNGVWKMMRIENLQVGDVLYDVNGNLVPVTSVEVIIEAITVYKLTLEDKSHTYFANGILTHNIK